MASSGEQRMDEMTKVLCAGGLLHPNNPPVAPCVLCRATAEFFFGEQGLPTALARIGNEINAARLTGGR